MPKISGMTRTQLWLLYILSGSLMGAALIFPVAWLGGVAGVVLFIAAIASTQSVWMLVGGGIVGWTVKMLFATSYILTVYPVEGIQIDLGNYEIPVILFYWLTSAFSIGVVGAYIAPVAAAVYAKGPRLFLLGFPVIWVSAEVIGSFLYSFFMYGEGSNLNISNTGGYIGYALAEHQTLLMTSYVGGVYMLTFITVVFAVCVWLLRKSFSSQWMMATGLALAIILGVTTDVRWFLRDFEVDGTTVMVIDTEFGGTAFYSTYTKEEQQRLKSVVLEEAVAKALAVTPEYIVLSEDSLMYGSGVSAETAYEQFRLFHNEPQTVVMMTGPAISAGGGGVVRSVIFDGIGKRGYSVDKQYLVPLGEYMPLLYELSLGVLGLEAELQQMKSAFSFNAGPKSGQATLPAHIPAVMFCFESLDAQGAYSLLKERTAPFVSHPISHAWFHEPRGLWHQLDATLKVQAVWSQTPIVSAANMAHGALYTPQGTKVLPEKVVEGPYYKVGIVSL